MCHRTNALTESRVLSQCQAHTGWKAQRQRAVSAPSACFPSAGGADASQVPCKVRACAQAMLRSSWLGGTPKEART